MRHAFRLLLLISLVAMFAISVPSASLALAAVGDLTQPPGALGCIENNPTNAGDPCAASTYGLGLDGAQYVATYGSNVYVMSGYGIEVLKKDTADAGLQDLQCLDGDGSDYGQNPDCTIENMMAGSNFNYGSLRVSPDGKWVFVDDDASSNGGDQLIVFSRNATSGEAEPGKLLFVQRRNR